MTALTTTLFTELLRDVGRARIEVTGCSMLPSIFPGDILQVESSPARVGDVVVFNRDGFLCAHRLLAIIDGQAIARGDAVRKLDLPVPCDEILGRVTAVERSGATIQDLKFRRWSSLVLRNSSLARRVFLRILAARRKALSARYPSLQTNQADSKSRA